MQCKWYLNLKMKPKILILMIYGDYAPYGTLQQQILILLTILSSLL